MKFKILVSFACLTLGCLAMKQPLHAQSIGSVTVFHAFGARDSTGGNTDGIYPDPGLVLDADGNFLGRTLSGGTKDRGTVFRITPSGEFRVLHDLDASSEDSYDHSSGLVLGRDGNFYGTTFSGGGSGNGTAFKLTPTGAFSTLHEFTASEGKGPGTPVLGRDGNFYGSTFEGPPDASGTVFKLTPAGAVTVLHTFHFTDGENPSNLTLGGDGNLYGIAGTRTANGFGDSIVFSITPAGVLSTFHVFKGFGFAGPSGELLLGRDGNFYGTTFFGGTYGNGAVYSLTASGVFRVLASFHDTNNRNTNAKGGQPAGKLLQGSDGSIYGTSRDGGTGANGTVFRVTPAGVLTNLHSFSPSGPDSLGRPYGPNIDGANPIGDLIEGRDGNIYGHTFNGGANDHGTLFRVNLRTPAVFLDIPDVDGNKQNVIEGGPTAQVLVTRSAVDLSKPLTIRYKVKGNNVPGADYEKLTGKLTIPAGAASAPISLRFFDDKIADGTKALKLRLLVPEDGSYVLATPLQVKVHVFDAEAFRH